jgi:hypothetical protein
MLTGTIVPGNGLTGNVAVGNSFVQGMTSGARGTITSISSTYVYARNVTGVFTAGEAVRFRLGASATTSPLAGNSTGTIKTSTTPYGRMSYYDTVNFANTKLHLSNTSYMMSNVGVACTHNRMFKTNMWVKGSESNTIAKIISLDNIAIDVIKIQSDSIIPSNTSITVSGKFATSNTAKETAFISLNPNQDSEFSSPRYILSRSMESNTSLTSATMATNKSMEIKYDIESRNSLASPGIDLRRISAVTVHNLISTETEVGTSEEFVKFGGDSKSRYISRTVVLADGQDAEDLRVYLTAYKPSGSDVQVFYKVLHREDSDSLHDSRWIKMERNVDQGFSSAAKYSSAQNKDDFFEMVFDVPAYTNTARSGANTANLNIIEYRNTSRARFVGFKYFTVKIILLNANSSNPPRVKDLRAMALQR